MKRTTTDGAPRNVRVFFYGSFINRDVLARADYHPTDFEVARLDGFDIVRKPLATLRRSDQHCVYGVLTSATHAELARLYGQEWVQTYLPEAALVTTTTGAIHPALVYIAHGATGAPPFANYPDAIIDAAVEWGFPKWYLERLEKLRD